MTEQTTSTFNETDEILSRYGITPDAKGDLLFEENKSENAYYITAQRFSLREANDPDADQIALEAGLIDTLPESKKECPDDVYIWRLDTPEEGRYEADETEARAWFAESVDWYCIHMAETLDEVLGDHSSDPHAWMTEATSDDDRKVTPNEYADILIWHLVSGEQNLDENIAKHVVSEFRRLSPYLFAQMWMSYRPDMESSSGAVNIYMPDGYQSAVEYLAEKQGVFDNRGNASISAFIRKLIEREIAS